MNFLAFILSFLFHPVSFFVFMPFLIIHRQTQSGWYALKWEVFSLAFLFIGILLILLARFIGVFSDLDVSKREERGKFYFLVGILAVVYFLLAVLFKGLSFSISIIALGIIVGIVVIDIINMHTKASVHSAVTAAWVLSMGILYGSSAFLIAVWILPVVIWARLALKRHTFAEAMAGVSVGSLITLLTFAIGKHMLASSI